MFFQIHSVRPAAPAEDEPFSLSVLKWNSDSSSRFFSWDPTSSIQLIWSQTQNGRLTDRSRGENSRNSICLFLRLPLITPESRVIILSGDEFIIWSGWRQDCYSLVLIRFSAPQTDVPLHADRSAFLRGGTLKRTSSNRSTDSEAASFSYTVRL